ncbi:MAG: phosphate acyltransferase, partial [Sulfurimonadaceae bacterium]|nr:phosphate acyltransferase [Sulfurimonadaceae bacterium]
MNIKSLYIAASEKNVGMLFVSMGMMEILRKNLPRVAFFRPIVASKDVRDHDIEFMLEKYELEQSYEEACGFDLEYVEFMMASKLEDELLNKMIEKFKYLEDKYDFVLCEGIRRSSFGTVVDYDLNVKLAQNFGSAYINIINAKERSAQEIYENILIENEHIIKSGSTHFSTFVNRLDEKKIQILQERLVGNNLNVSLLREIKELDMPTIEDVVEALGAEKISFREEDNARVIKRFKIAALSVNNYLEYIEEGDFVIVPADRSDIILALMCSLYSREYPKISGIVFPFGMKPHENIQKLMDGLKRLNIPILSVKEDTYQTAAKLQNIYAKLRVKSERKTALALGLFHASIDMEKLENTLANQKSEILTPKMFEYRLFESARQNRQRIVLPESKDERVLRAAEIILRRNVADIILLGDEQKVREHYLSLGLDLADATIINPLTSPLRKEFAEQLYALRKEEGMTEAA